MSRICIVHIGTPKTGSTAIQKSLGMARSRLRAVGIEYPRPAHYSLGPSFFGLPDKSEPGLDGLTMERLQEVLRTTDGDYVVISNESLSNPNIAAARVGAFLDAISACHFVPRVVAFVRPQPSLINSEYVQMIQSLRKNNSFSQYFIARENNESYYLTKRFSSWIQDERSDLRALPFNSQFRGPALAVGMLKAVGVPAERLNAAAIPALSDVNQSFGPLAVAATRYALPRLTEAGLSVNNALRKIVRQRATERGWNSDRFSGFDSETVLRFAARFQEDNAAFAARLFDGGQTWDDAFFSDYQQKWEINEVDLSDISSERQREFDEFADDIITTARSTDRQDEGGKVFLS